MNTLIAIFKLYYKIIITICFLFFINKIDAQIVVTVAGQAEVPGEADGPAFDATFNNPHGIAVDQNGNVYTCDRWSHLIRKITPDGMVSTVAGRKGISGDMDGDTTIALFNEPWGICVDQQGNILVADTRNNKIRKISPSGIVSTVAGSGNFGSSDGIGTSSTFGNPTGIECDAEGNIYVADHLTHIIRKIDPNGVVSTIAGTPYLMGSTDGPGGIASFARPYGLSLDNDGNILVADEWNHKIRKIDLDGVVSTVAGNGAVGSLDGEVESSSFNYPWDITVDSMGNIFVADGYNYLIRKITTDGMVASFAGTLETTGATDGMGSLATFSGATAIAISPLTKEIFIGDAYNNLVRKLIDLNQGVSVLMTGNSSPTVCMGETLEFYASPDIYNSYFFYLDGQIVQSNSSPNFSISNLEEGTHQLQVVVQDNGNTFPSSPRTITVLPRPVPTVSVIGETSFYAGDSAILIASNAASYFWSNGEIEPTLTVTESGNYYVEVSDENGCFGISEEVSIEVISNPEAPQISINGPTQICMGSSSQLISNSQDGNQWLKDGWPISGANANVLEVNSAGMYQVQVLLSTGTTVISEPTEITMLPAFNLEFTSDLTNINPGGAINFQVSQSNLSNIAWDFGDPTSPQNNSTISNPTHTYLQDGIYTISLSAINNVGCSDTIVERNYIIVGDSDNNSNNNNNNSNNNQNIEDDLFIPTAFTPNGDGVNDILFVRGSDISELSFNIYDHWGAMIFESNDQQNGWNGKIQGIAVQNGNYVYCASITKSDGSTRQLVGRVTILR